MKSVNLLPKWYLRQHTQRRRLRIHFLMMTMLLSAMIGAEYIAKKRVAILDGQREELRDRVSRIGDPEAELKKRRVDLTRLEDLQLAYRELGKTIPMSAVIQQLPNDMTKGMALSHVAIEVRPDPVKGSGLIGDTRNPPRYHDVAYLNVEGIAPTDVQIAQLIEKLSTNPLFSEVTLNYTRTGTLQTFMVRRFEIQMKMDLERLTTEDPGTRKVAAGGSEHAN